MEEPEGITTTTAATGDTAPVAEGSASPESEIRGVDATDVILVTPTGVEKSGEKRSNEAEQVEAKKSPPPDHDGRKEKGEAALVPDTLQYLIRNDKSGATTQQQVEALKFLHTIVKHLADPDRIKEPKYRQLCLSDDKAQAAKMLPFATQFMTTSVGFQAVVLNGAKYLRIDVEDAIDDADDIQAALMEVEEALASLEGKTLPQRSPQQRSAPSTSSIGSKSSPAPEEKVASPETTTAPPENIGTTSPSEQEHVNSLESTCYTSRPKRVMNEAVLLYLASDPDREKFGFAQFDSLSVNGNIKRNAAIIVDRYQLNMQSHTSSFGQIKHCDISYVDFKAENARFIGNGDVAAAPVGEKLGVRIVSVQKGQKSGPATIIECFYDHSDPDAIVDEDGITIMSHLRRFVKDFVRLHERWRSKNPAKARESDKRKLIAKESSPPSPIVHVDPPNTYLPTQDEALMSSYMDVISESVVDSRPHILQEFVRHMEEYQTNQINSDVVICRIANLFVQQRSVVFLNKFLPPGKYAIESQFSNEAVEKKYYAYRSPSGTRTTHMEGDPFLVEMREAPDAMERLAIVKRHMDPMPSTFLETKTLLITTVVLGLIVCKSYEEAQEIVENALSVLTDQLNEQGAIMEESASTSSTLGIDADVHEALGPLYDLRGLVIARSVKERLATKRLPDLANCKGEARRTILASDWASGGIDLFDVASTGESDIELQIALRQSLLPVEALSDGPNFDSVRLQQPAVEETMTYDEETNALLDQARDSFHMAKKVLEKFLDSRDSIASFADTVSVAPSMNINDTDGANDYLVHILCDICKRIATTWEIQNDLPSSIKCHEEALCILHQVREVYSGRVAKGHYELGDLFAKTLIPCRDGSWDKAMKGRMAHAVAHFLSSAHSTASLVLLSNGPKGLGFIPNPADEMRAWLHPEECMPSICAGMETTATHEDEPPTNIAEWALWRYSEMQSTCEAMMHARGAFSSPCSIDMAYDAMERVEGRLVLMSRHPMFTETRGVDGVEDMKPAPKKWNEEEDMKFSACEDTVLYPNKRLKMSSPIHVIGV